MAHKHDRFWEKHPPVGGDGTYSPGLRLYEYVGTRHLYAYVATLVLLATFIFLQESQVFGWLPPLAYVACAAALIADIAWPALAQGKRRYRLYDEDSDAAEFDGKPEKVAALLPAIAASERLWMRLSPPEPRAYPESVFRVALPTMSKLLPIYVLLGSLALLMLAIVVLIPPFSPWETLCLLLFLAGFLLSLVPAWLAYRRIRLGIQVLGSGEPAVDGEDVMARFEEAIGVELHWDRWLGIPYLLVDLYGASVRYYSPVGDPLHLLRLAKYRMPHLTLQV